MTSRKFQVFDDFKNLNLNQFIYHLAMGKPPSLEIGFPLADGKLVRVYLKTPVLEMGQVYHYKDQDYLDLKIQRGESPTKVSDFRNFLVTLDQYHLSQIEANQKIWGYDGSVCQPILNQSFRHILNFSGKSGKEYFLVKFDPAQLKIFDQNDQKISLDQLKPEQISRAILELEGLICQDGIFETSLRLIQLKTRISPEIKIPAEESSKTSTEAE
jgi:hypothetical protein